MTILSDKDIKKYLDKGKIEINPINIKSIQPASVDLHLNWDLKDIDGNVYDINKNEYLLIPNEFILGSTLEEVKIPNDLVGIIEGRSSVGRLGITAHITAGYIDPGFNGRITLEITNVSTKPFILKKGMSICQIVFQELSCECENPYGSDGLNSKYQNSKGTVTSKYEEL